MVAGRKRENLEVELPYMFWKCLGNMLIVQEQQMLDCPNTDMKKEYRSLLKTAKSSTIWYNEKNCVRRLCFITLSNEGSVQNPGIKIWIPITNISVKSTSNHKVNFIKRM